MTGHSIRASRSADRSFRFQRMADSQTALARAKICRRSKSGMCRCVDASRGINQGQATRPKCAERISRRTARAGIDDLASNRKAARKRVTDDETCVRLSDLLVELQRGRPLANTTDCSNEIV